MVDNDTLRARYRNWRKKIVARMPFVKRSRYERMIARMREQAETELQRERQEKEALGYLFLARPPLAATAHYVVRVPFASAAADELCIFVTHAASASLKPHVIEHIDALIDAGVEVVLAVNTELEPSALQIPPALAARLRACIIRENAGYDFGAWAHVYAMLDRSWIRRRLFLVNDSIVGPLDRTAYLQVVNRIRDSPADVIGLTTNPHPREHLQSYYLVLNERALRSAAFDGFMRQVVNFTRKELVIDCYETWLTSFLRQQGFACASIFPNLGKPPPFRDDTLWHWRELLELGFPFVKASALKSVPPEEARLIVPERFTAR